MSGHLSRSPPVYAKSPPGCTNWTERSTNVAVPAMNTEQLARRLRRHVVQMTNAGRSSHVGSALSLADVVAVLYGSILSYRASEPSWPHRDRVILSKGHAGAIVYAALAEAGFFSTKELATHCQNGSRLSGHVSHVGVPGVEVSTGSLGHGLGIGVGMALAIRSQKRSSRVFVLLSDGECDEGSVWEAALFAGHHRLSSLVAIVDYNKLQSLSAVADTLELEPLADKWRAFGWVVREVDGHSHTELESVLVSDEALERPLIVIAHTVKGRGVSFMENSVLWHYRSPQGGEFEQALAELGEEDA